MAIDFKLYAYDAYFLQCAINQSCPLLTLDKGMKKVASRGSLTLRIRMTNVAFLSDVSIILLPNRFFCLTWLSSDVH